MAFKVGDRVVYPHHGAAVIERKEMHGDEVVDIIAGLRVPSIVVAHTVLKDPTPHQRSVLEAIAAAADQPVKEAH